MSITVPGPHQRSTFHRTGWLSVATSVVASVALVAVLVPGFIVLDAASVAAQANPDVLPAVDLGTLNPEPLAQWGVVGVGASNNAAKALVWDFLEIGNRIYVAGMFTGVQKDQASAPIAQPYIAAFYRETGVFIASFAPKLDRAVYALAKSPDGKLLAGGEFTSVNGVARTGLVKLDPNTGQTVGADAIAVAETTVFVAVAETTVAPVALTPAQAAPAGAVTPPIALAPADIGLPAEPLRNSIEEPISLDETGLLACANDQLALIEHEQGDRSKVAGYLQIAVKRAEVSAVSDIKASASKLRGAMASLDPVPPMEAFLELCYRHGFEY